jgi:uncharacterized lipoprotein YddW (UPF0748 family)
MGLYAGYHDPGYDPLAYVVQEAHKRAWKFMPGLTVFRPPAQ